VNEEQRPLTSRPDPGEGGVRGDARSALVHVLELIKGGNIAKAIEVGEAFLKSPGPGSNPAEGEQAVAKSLLLDRKMALRLEEAFANLQVGPGNLAAAEARIRADKDLLRALDVVVRAPSRGRRLLAELDKSVKEGQS
jgi:hypothetical protein